MVCLVTLTTGGCVMRSTYDEVVVDLEATKAELDSTRTQSQALTDQVNELEQHKIVLARQMEATSSALQQANQEMEAEHTASQEQLSKLHRTMSQLAAQQNSLRYALQRANTERSSLQSIVERYKPTLGEADGPGAPPFPPPIARTNEQVETALAPPAQAPVPIEAAPNATVTTPAAPADPTAANPKPQRADKQTFEPVEQGWLSVLKGWVISFWRSIFS
jgi:ABC-type transporter Mla subunit MlaD